MVFVGSETGTYKQYLQFFRSLLHEGYSAVIPQGWPRQTYVHHKTESKFLSVIHLIRVCLV